MKPRSLQRRLVFFILLPVAVLLMAMGWLGLLYAKNSILNQWSEASTLKLQRAAHFVDMQLSRPKELLKMLQSTGGQHHAEPVRRILIDQLKAIGGVARVDVKLNADEPEQGNAGMPPLTRPPLRHMMAGAGSMDMPFHMGMVDVTPPRYDPSIEERTLSLVADLRDAGGLAIGTVKVHLRFDALVGAVEAAGWWRSHKAYIIDRKGKVLVSSFQKATGEFADAAEDALAETTLSEMETMPFGTVFGKGFPPNEIAGFYRLHEAPWTLVITAPGDEVLAPILRFQALYLVTGVVFIGLILILIRFVAGTVVASIREVSQAAERVARGSYGIRLRPRSGDEVGDLVESFNRMVVQLEERAKIKTSLNLAMEVQQNLLPQKSMRFEFLDTSGQSRYCDEIGGDYYDFLQVPLWGTGRIGVAVGDVTGHGVPAALLMATARALIASSAEKHESLAAMLDEVNRLLCRDTESSGHFMTLFLMRFDSARKEIRWVRAGHDPAVVYNPDEDAFTDLIGEGMALGVDPGYRYTENVTRWGEGQIVAIATDGVWEAEGAGGERFGRQRLKQTIRAHRTESSKAILKAVCDEVEAFREGRKPEDDVTMVIVKAQGGVAAKGGST